MIGPRSEEEWEAYLQEGRTPVFKQAALDCGLTRTELLKSTVMWTPGTERAPKCAACGAFVFLHPSAEEVRTACTTARTPASTASPTGSSSSAVPEPAHVPAGTHEEILATVARGAPEKRVQMVSRVQRALDAWHAGNRGRTLFPAPHITLLMEAMGDWPCIVTRRLAAAKASADWDELVRVVIPDLEVDAEARALGGIIIHRQLFFENVLAWVSRLMRLAKDLASKKVVDALGQEVPLGQWFWAEDRAGKMVRRALRIIEKEATGKPCVNGADLMQLSAQDPLPGPVSWGLAREMGPEAEREVTKRIALVTAHWRGVSMEGMDAHRKLNRWVRELDLGGSSSDSEGERKGRKKQKNKKKMAPELAALEVMQVGGAPTNPPPAGGPSAAPQEQGGLRGRGRGGLGGRRGGERGGRGPRGGRAAPNAWRGGSPGRRGGFAGGRGIGGYHPYQGQ